MDGAQRYPSIVRQPGIAVIAAAVTFTAWAAAAMAGCGRASDAEVRTDGGGAAATGGSSGGTGGGGGSGSGTCPQRADITLAQLMVLDASWPGTTAASAGSGKIHLWTLAKLTAAGGALTGETRSCGTTLPEVSFTATGQLVTGGTRLQLQVPHAVWDMPSLPRFSTSGTLSGFATGSSIAIDPIVVLVGLTLPDPRAAWPDSYTGLTAVDAEGDGEPGITAVPRTGDGYVLPPTGLGVGGTAPQADRVYIAFRTIIDLSGTFTTCAELGGTVNVMFFDNHVVGCHVRGGENCSPTQVDFVDQSRTIYRISAGTFTAKQVADTATCADVHAALPMTM
jgi:hypothetical protein